MWNVFKITNLLWLLTSTYWWLTAPYNLGPVIAVVNVAMIVCLSLLNIEWKLNAQFGRILAAITAISLWYMWIDGAVVGVLTLMMCLPVLYLIQLPYEYQKDLLHFTTKWYAILLIPALLIYGMTLFTKVPSIGQFIQPGYPPFINHVFYIETVYDNGIFVRFNAFFIEPGHQALLSTFLLIANRFRFKEFPLLWVLVAAIIFSFSLAGYILVAVGFILLKVDTVIKFLTTCLVGGAVIGGAVLWSGGDNAMNDLIISRLEADDEKGIKGNNRFTDSTDFTFSRLTKKPDFWTGIKNTVNMDLIEGAGFKIYVINYGLIGVILVALFYLSLIPSNPDYRYTLAFLAVLTLCFFQRSYPFWYSWLFPYVIGIFLAKDEKEQEYISS